MRAGLCPYERKNDDVGDKIDVLPEVAKRTANSSSLEVNGLPSFFMPLCWASSWSIMR